MTTVPGPVLRSVGFDSFADLAPGVAVTRIGGDGIEFDGDLTPEQVAAVRSFITAGLAAHRDAAAAADLTTTDGLEALRAAVLAGLNYTLGDA